MDIVVSYNWLKEFLQTDLKAKELAGVISLYGPSIERWHPTENGDTILDVEITTNRIDAYSIYGLAREAYAILKYTGHKATFNELQTSEVINGSGVNLTLYPDVDHKLCPRFTAVILDGVEVRKSPNFIKERLEAVGERSLNNVVDITNYVMFELGQPMHVFDYDKIAGHKMTLRKSRAGEQVQTLDGQMRKLPEGAIVIEDAEKLIDLAGIMGGENSAVSENTTRVVLFVQTYNPHVIRKTSMQMAHRTEASARFEKGLDPELVMTALQRGVDLLSEHANAIVASDVIDLYPNPAEPKAVSISKDQIEQATGVQIPINQAAEILQLLGFAVETDSDTLTATIPSFRLDDIDNSADLVEEIARMYGYHNIPAVLPTGEIPQRLDNQVNRRTKQVKTALKYLGFTETFTYSATSKENIEKLGLETKNCVRIKNPFSEDFVYMRPHLLTTMLPVVAENLPRFPNLQIFELSKIYQVTRKDLPEEKRMLQIVTTNTGLLKLKGIVETLLEELHVQNVKTEPDEPSEKYQAGTTAIFTKGGKEIGHIGLLSPAIAKAYGIEKDLAVVKLFFDDLIKLASDTVDFQPVPQYPPIYEDISFVIPAIEHVGPIIDAIRSTDEYIVDIALLDTYVGDRVGEGQKSITLRLTYQDPEKLLSDKAVAPVREKVLSLLEKEFSATVRKA